MVSSSFLVTRHSPFHLSPPAQYLALLCWALSKLPGRKADLTQLTKMISDVNRARKDIKPDILEAGVPYLLRNRWRELGSLLNIGKDGQGMPVRKSWKI